MVLDNKDAINYVGGASMITAAFVNALTSFIKVIYGIGQNLGSTFRRAYNKTSC